MSTTTQYKLVYFNLRTLGEPIRMLLNYLDIQFEDVRIDPAEWQGQIRTSYKWHRLPELHTTTSNGKTYCLTQTSAICRYLANSYPTFELMPADPFDQAKCDIIVDAVQDLRIRMKPYIVAKYYDPQGCSKLPQLKKELLDDEFWIYLKNMNQILEEEKGDFICGAKVRWADFFLANFTAIWEEVFDDENLLKGYENLKQQQQAVESLPKIQEWIKQREYTKI